MSAFTPLSGIYGHQTRPDPRHPDLWVHTL